jgi:hypothetical protein
MGVINLCSPGHLDPFDSYGLIACELIRHLSEAGERVNPLCLGRDRHQNQTDEMAALIARPIMPAMGGIFLGYPTSYAKHSALAQSGPRVALSMFESSKIPPPGRPSSTKWTP